MGVHSDNRDIDRPRWASSQPLRYPYEQRLRGPASTQDILSWSA